MKRVTGILTLVSIFISCSGIRFSSKFSFTIVSHIVIAKSKIGNHWRLHKYIVTYCTFSIDNTQFNSPCNTACRKHIFQYLYTTFLAIYKPVHKLVLRMTSVIRSILNHLIPISGRHRARRRVDHNPCEIESELRMRRKSSGNRILINALHINFMGKNNLLGIQPFNEPHFIFTTAASRSRCLESPETRYIADYC